MFTYFRILNIDFELYSAKLRVFLMNLSLLSIESQLILEKELLLGIFY